MTSAAYLNCPGGAQSHQALRTPMCAPCKPRMTTAPELAVRVGCDRAAWGSCPCAYALAGIHHNGYESSRGRLKLPSLALRRLGRLGRRSAGSTELSFSAPRGSCKSLQAWEVHAALEPASAPRDTPLHVTCASCPSVLVCIDRSARRHRVAPSLARLAGAALRVCRSGRADAAHQRSMPDSICKARGCVAGWCLSAC